MKVSLDILPNNRNRRDTSEIDRKFNIAMKVTRDVCKLLGQSRAVLRVV